VISRQLKIATLHPNDLRRSTGQVILLLQIRHREGRIVAIEACMRRKQGPASTSLWRGHQISARRMLAGIETPTKTFSE
jgi:hypothetical protein